MLLFSLMVIPAGLGAERGELLFLGDKDYPPVTYLEGGQARGMDVDLAKSLSAPMQRTIRVELMDWTLAQEKMLKGEADGLLGLTITADRQKLYDFATPTFTREFGFVVQGRSTAIRGLSDLHGKRVGATPGGFPRKFVEDQPSAQLILVSTYQEGLDRLQSGSLDVLVADLWVAAHLIDTRRIEGLTVVEKPFATAPGAVAVRKGNTELLSEINQAISSLRESGRIAAIEDAWERHEIVFFSRGRLRSLIWQGIGLGLAALMAIMAVWILLLKKQINSRRQSEAALKRNEELFRAVVDDQSEMIVRWKPDGTRTFVNRAYSQAFGGTQADFVGTSFLPLVANEGDRTRIQKNISKLTPANPLANSVHQSRGPGGALCWQEWTDRGIFDDAGQLVELQSVGRDITARIETEEALRISEEKFSKTFASSPAPIAITRVDNGCFVDVNPAFERIFGFSRHELIGRSTLELNLWPDPKTRDEVVRELRENGSVINRDLQFRAKDGGLLVTLYSAVPIEIGGDTFLLSLPVDQTDRARAERSLRESEEKFSKAFISSPAPMAIARLTDGVLVDVNRAFETTFGLRREELLGQTTLGLGLWADAADRDRVVAQVRAGIAVVNQAMRFRDKDERLLQTQYSAVPVEIGGEPFMLGLVVDLTAHMAAKAALRESETKFKTLFETANDAIILMNEQVFLDCNRMTETMFGAPRQDILQHSPLDFSPERQPDGRASAEKAVEKIQSALAGYPQSFEWLHCRSDRTAFYVEVRLNRVELGGQFYLQAIVRDITERRQAEAALRNSEETLREALDAARMGIWDLDIETNQLEMSEQVSRLFGISPAEFPTDLDSIFTLIKSEDRGPLQERIADVISGRRPEYHAEFRAVWPDGSEHWLEGRGQVERDDKGRPSHLSGTVVDVTARKRAEQERIAAVSREKQAREEYTKSLIASQEAERQRIAGELHDSLGQNLLLVKNRAQLAWGLAGDHVELREHLAGINELTVLTIEEVRQISRELRPYQLDQLGFTRALAAMIESAIQAAPDLRIHRRLEDVDDVLGSEAATHLYRVAQESLNNILKHASAREVRIELERDIQRIQLVIVDDGRGFDSSADGSAHGFGLRNVFERVRILGGSIALSSTPGNGTRIDVEIPIRGEI